MKEELQKITNCSHCGNKVPNDWESGWPMFGKITMGMDSSSLDYLWKDKTNERLGFNHPAMIKSSYQEINLEWGNGFRFDSRGRGYRLCRNCQRKLMALIGSFFENDIAVGGIGEPPSQLDQIERLLEENE